MKGEGHVADEGSRRCQLVRLYCKKLISEALNMVVPEKKNVPTAKVKRC